MGGDVETLGAVAGFPDDPGSSRHVGPSDPRSVSGRFSDVAPGGDVPAPPSTPSRGCQWPLWGNTPPPRPPLFCGKPVRRRHDGALCWCCPEHARRAFHTLARVVSR